MVPGHKWFSVESGTCLHIADLGTGQRDTRSGAWHSSDHPAWLTARLRHVTSRVVGGLPLSSSILARVGRKVRR